LRRRIDAVDKQLVALLNTRAVCAIQIARLKRLDRVPVRQPDREQAVLQHAMALAASRGGPWGGDAIARLFACIIDETRRLEARYR
jgi:chorismate mutase